MTITLSPHQLIDAIPLSDVSTPDGRTVARAGQPISAQGAWWIASEHLPIAALRRIPGAHGWEILTGAGVVGTVAQYGRNRDNGQARHCASTTGPRANRLTAWADRPERAARALLAALTA